MLDIFITTSNFHDDFQGTQNKKPNKIHFQSVLTTFILAGFVFICFPSQSFGFSVFFKDKPFKASQKNESEYKILNGTFPVNIKALNLKNYNSPKDLNPLSQLKWYQNRRKWEKCVKTAENLSEDYSLGVWVALTHLTCMTNWYKTTRGLKVSSILNSFKKLETKKKLFFNSKFRNHRKDFINSFLDICELISKYSRQRLAPLIEQNKDITDFMDWNQQQRYQNLLNKTDLTDRNQTKQSKELPSQSENRLWFQFSKAFRKRQRLKVIKYAVRFLSQFPESKRVDPVRTKTHRTHKYLFRRSEKKWESLKKSFEKELLKASTEDLLFWINRSYNQGYYDISLDLAEKVTIQNRKTENIAKILLLAGRSAYNQSDFQRAEIHFQNLMEKHSIHDSSHEARYLLGLIHYRKGDYKKVISIYDSFLKKPDSDPWELQIRYWLWRSFKKTNSTKKAKIMAESILKEFPLTYYGLIIRQQEKNSLQSLVSSEIQPLSSILWETRGTGKDWERIKRLLELGWIREAQQEIEIFQEPGQASGFVVRSLFWHSASLFNECIKDYASAIDRDHRFISRNLLEIVFPQMYKEFVLKAEKEFSISRDLIWSMIRQESAFTLKAVSPSKAYGLMQIRAPTARETARLLKARGFYTSRDIFKPEYNIRFGTHYFLRMLRKYKRVSPLAIAAYNVGPGNLDRWLSYRKDLKDWDKTGASFDDDLWMDELPWSETSFYVKAVLRNYLLYGIIHNRENKLSHPPWLNIVTVTEKSQ